VIFLPKSNSDIFSTQKNERRIHMNSKKLKGKKTPQNRPSVFAYSPDAGASTRICKDNFPQELFGIVGIVAQDCEFQLELIYSERGKLYLRGHSGEEQEGSELVLRYYGQRLILASVQFVHRRQGQMTHLYEILKMMKKNHGYACIIIENACTPEMMAWCAKNGLHPIGDGYSFSDEEVQTHD
jgi:hypothetical protein